MTWRGHSGAALARALGLPQVDAHGSVQSTMDTAHALAAEGAPAGTLVIAEEQRAGRGRGGRAWTSRPGAGIWMTLIERPLEASGVDVLSLRVGLRLAPVLDRWAPDRVLLKWPNDLYIARRKLAGVLIEVRWRGTRPDWVAIGLGINLRPPPEVPEAIGLDAADAIEVLAEVVPAMRAAAHAAGPLEPREVLAFAERDLAVGQHVLAPADGTVRGILPTGELLLESEGRITPFRAGSLVFATT